MALSTGEKIKKGARRPNLIKIWLYDHLFEKLLKPFRKNYKWSKDSQKIGRKIYRDYSEYIYHQMAKLETMDLLDYDVTYRKILSERLETLARENIIKKGNVALCLAARIGTEVKSFMDLECFAVGIDLNPGNKNKYVLYGDFHEIQFSNNSVDIIFTNSIDHAFDFDKLIKEIKRVLKPDGYIILEVGKGTEEGGKFGYYEAVTWKRVDDCLEPFMGAGFSVIKRHDFSWPWAGEQVVLKL